MSRKETGFVRMPAKQQRKGKEREVRKVLTNRNRFMIIFTTTAVQWLGLVYIYSAEDAVREADGNAMIPDWKLDLVNFFASKHPKYLILAHKYMAGYP